MNYEHMDKSQWDYASHSLRKLLHKFNEEDTLDRAIEFQFGLKYNPMYGFYNLYDCHLKQSVATIRLDTHQTVTRFLDTWVFKNELFKLKMDDRKSLFIPSNNITRHDEWVQMQLQRRCERAMAERAGFLAQEELRRSPTVRLFSFPMRHSIGTVLNSLQEATSPYLTEVSSNSVTVMVQFGQVPTAQMMESCLSKLRDLIQEIRFDPHQAIPVEQIDREHEHYVERRRINEIQENAFRELSQQQVRRYAQQLGAYQFRHETQTDEFYGRPVEQLREYLTTTATGSVGQSLTEEDLVHAVHALDEANVPREADPGRVREYFGGFRQEYDVAWEGAETVNIPYETVAPRDVVIDHPRPQSNTLGYNLETIRRLMDVSEN